MFSQSPGSNSCCRTPPCSDNKSLEGSARGLRSDISAHFWGDSNIQRNDAFEGQEIGKWRWLYLWRTGYALAVLQRAKVFGRAAAALGHRGKIAIRAKLEIFLEDIKLGTRFWLLEKHLHLQWLQGLHLQYDVVYQYVSLPIQVEFRQHCRLNICT